MSTISGILRKAITFPLKNKKLMLQVYFLFLSAIFSIVLLHHLIATPSIAKVEDSYENSSLNKKDVVSLVVIEIPFVFAFSLVLLFASSITILACVSAYQDISLGLIEILLSLKFIWKKTIVSWLFSSSLMTAFIGLTMALTRLTAVMGVLAALVYPYLASICTLVLVISTVENDFQGQKAFRHAQELIRHSSFKGYFLMLVLVLLSIPVNVLFYVTSTDDDDDNDSITQFVFLLVATVLFCQTVSFNNVVYTLFYLDCKQRNGEKIEMERRVECYQIVKTQISCQI